jgi:multiphosphoryl transfer protein
VVGLVIVSHSAALAGGVVELARQMGGEDVRIEAAGGMAEPEGAIGTDAMLVHAAIERAAGPDGVLVLMDLGSAVMSAEMAVEMASVEHDVEIVLSEAPLVEGAVAAAARAGAGAPLAEVAAEARAALGMKAATLGVEPGPGAAPDAAPPEDEDPDALEERLPVGNPLGLHARPAARFVETAARFQATITVRDERSGKGPADARSLSGLVMLGARQGDTLLVRAGGPDAQAALDALRALAADGYGDGPVAVAASAPAPEAEPEPAAPAATPASGDRLTGIPVAPGIVIAPARRPAGAARPEVPDTPAGAPAEERTRLEEARAAARRDVEAARERIAARTGAGEAAIFDAHLLLLDDAALLDPALRAIDDGASAARAWDAAVTATAASYRELPDAYLRERAADVQDVGDRVLGHLVGAPAEAGTPSGDGGVLVVDDLTPGDAAALDPDAVAGLALARGGATSHAAILSRALGIPSVAGLGAGVLGIGDGTTIVLDGTAGTLEVDPAPERLAELEGARDAARERRARARERAHEPARTRDGTTIEVMANAGAPQDAAAAVALGADGIGLLRTEFLFLDRDDAPTEEEQVAVYREVAEGLEGRPLVLRTLDAGADKPLRFLPQAPEENPFLGVRGIRLALARPGLLATQLRAALTVARDHPVQVMFPMVATLAEYRAARAVLDEARAAVGAPEIPVGVMVEVPAVALAAERFAREVDFLSIGTNDLTQYTMAAERGNDALAGLLGGPQPAVLRLAAAVAEGAEAHGRWAGVCGELAGDPGAALLLAALGIRELSMAAPLVPEVKEALRGVDLGEVRPLARQALELDDAAAVAELVAPLLGSAR